MRLLRMFSVLALMLSVQCALAAQPKEGITTTTLKYKGNSYVIGEMSSTFFIRNKKFVNPNEELFSPSWTFPNESVSQYISRNGKKFRNRADSIVFSVFTPEEISILKKHGFGKSYYFDTKTSDYVGCELRGELSVQDILTVERMYRIEQKLLKAHLNAGKQNLEKADRKYFAI